MIVSPAKRPRELSVYWGNRYTTPPDDIAVIEGTRTRWAVCVWSIAVEDEMWREHAPSVAPGSGWCHGIGFPVMEPPRRWSAEAKGRVRRRRLRRRLERRWPLLADQLYERAVAERPAYYHPES